MEKVTKYIAVRETAGANARTYRRYEEYEDEEFAITWFAGRDLGACRSVSIYAVEFEDGEGLSTMQPCAKKNIPNVGTLVYKKRHNKVLYDRREEEPEAEATTEESSAVAEEAPAEPTESTEAVEPIKAGEPVRYYAVLKISENRKQTKFHYKRRVFYDDEDAIRFARSRIRGGCVSAAVFLYDPVTTRYPPERFESMNAQRDAANIRQLLMGLKIFYASRTIDMDLRDVVHDMLVHPRESA